MIEKEIILKSINSLQKDALLSEKENIKEFDVVNMDLHIRGKDQQYWNGYLDACENMKKEIRKIH